MDKYDYKKLTPFKWFVLENFPFIEADFDALTEWQLFCKLGKEINKIIDSQNNVGQQMENVTNAFIALQDYVNNYFDNLDVQEEINNKLNDMAESGELEDIIAAYLNTKAVMGFDTVADMKTAENLADGTYVQTYGFYNINDGGKALYKIRTITNDDIVDEMTIIELYDDTLIAELILDDNINIKQLGARPQNEDTKYDIKDYIDKYLDIQTLKNKKYNLYIPSGVWYTSGNYLHHKFGFNIYGDECFPGFDGRAVGTIITTYSNNQDYIFRLGSSAHICNNWNLKNLVFSSADITYNGTNKNYYFGTLKNVTKAVDIHYGEYGISDNLFFMYINGNCLTINSCWENYFKLLNFRSVSNENGSIMNFETKDTTLGSANISANNFEKIMFERFHGNLMNFEATCDLYNNHFNVINVEDGQYLPDVVSYTTFTDEILSTWDDTDCIHYAVINLEDNSRLGENVFDSIELNNYSNKYYTYNEQKYVYDTIVKYGNSCSCNNIFNNINANGMLKSIKVIYLPSTITTVQSSRQFNTFNNFGTDSTKSFIFDVNGLNGIECNGYLFGNGNSYSFSVPTHIFFELGGWIPCYKSLTKRTYPTGLGCLFYDADAINSLNLIVKPRPDNFDRSFLNSVVNTNKTLYVRAKVPNGQDGKFNITNKTTNENIVATLAGDGTYKIYEISLTNTWNVGDLLYCTVGGSSASQRDLYLDVYKSE